MKNWRLRRMLLPDERAAVEAVNCTTDWQDGVLAEEEIDSIQCADDPLAAAMPYMVAGHATFIEFSPDKLIATCGDFTREIQRSDAVAMDDWLALIGGIVEKPEQYCACSVLYSTDTRLILAEPLESEAIEDLLRYIEASSSGRGERWQAPNWGGAYPHIGALMPPCR